MERDGTIINATNRHPLPRRLTAFAGQPPRAEAVIRPPANAPSGQLLAAPLTDTRMGTRCRVALRRTFRGLRPLWRKGFRSAPMNAPPLRCGAPLPSFTPGLALWLLAESMFAFLF